MGSALMTPLPSVQVPFTQYIGGSGTGSLSNHRSWGGPPVQCHGPVGGSPYPVPGLGAPLSSLRQWPTSDGRTEILKTLHSLSSIGNRHSRHKHVFSKSRICSHRVSIRGNWKKSIFACFFCVENDGGGPEGDRHSRHRGGKTIFVCLNGDIFIPLHSERLHLHPLLIYSC